MTFILRYDPPAPEYRKVMDGETKKIARAATLAVTEAAALIKAEGRSSVASLSGKLANSVFAKVFPGRGDSLTPAAMVGMKVKYASVFEEGATVSGKPLLWIPLSSAPAGRGGARMGPGQFVKNVGVLYTIKRPGKPPLLAAVVRSPSATSAPSLAALKRGRNPGGRGKIRLVPLYVGVPTVTDPKKYNLTEIIQKYADDLPKLYERNWDSLKNG